jgi:hypothetical protein
MMSDRMAPPHMAGCCWQALAGLWWGRGLERTERDGAQGEGNLSSRAVGWSLASFACLRDAEAEMRSAWEEWAAGLGRGLNTRARRCGAATSVRG